MTYGENLDEAIVVFSSEFCAIKCFFSSSREIISIPGRKTGQQSGFTNAIQNLTTSRVERTFKKNILLRKKVAIIDGRKEIKLLQLV